MVEQEICVRVQNLCFRYRGDLVIVEEEPLCRVSTGQGRECIQQGNEPDHPGDSKRNNVPTQACLCGSPLKKDRTSISICRRVGSSGL